MNLACVFPGQGAQSIGMLNELAKAQAEVGNTFEEASEVLSYDLWRLAMEGPEAVLNNTRYTQPLMLTAGIAVWRVWQSQKGHRPVMLAGHSLGEYTALVCGEVLDFTDALPLVQTRARLMQEATGDGEGAMAAILGLDEALVADLCEQAAAGEVVEAVNFNAPGQIVIAGQQAAVERTMQAAHAAGASRVIELAVSVPAHCRLMAPAAELLAERLTECEFHAPAIPVLHNADVASYNDAAAIRDALKRQLYNPVRWRETINTMKENGIDTVLEMGPGKVLMGLVRRIERRLATVCIHDSASLQKAWELCLKDEM